ncbi:MAG: hypothetical protein HY664_06730 [Chloroflexi bacterium]|nr:hypothetical protein [Chloroflexota bacterium]
MERYKATIPRSGKLMRQMAQGLALFFGLSYIILFVDVLLEHRVGLAPTGSAKLVPVVFSLFAAGTAVMAGLWPKRQTLNAFTLIMALSILVGLAGAYFHLRSSLANLTVNTLYVFPPKLAPLAFSGIGIMGLLVTFGFLKPTLEKDTVVLDPICGRRISKVVAVAVVRTDGAVYGLCCPLCEQEFRKRAA